MQQQQPATVTHSHISSLLISRRLSSSVQTSSYFKQLTSYDNNYACHECIYVTESGCGNPKIFGWRPLAKPSFLNFWIRHCIVVRLYKTLDEKLAVWGPTILDQNISNHSTLLCVPIINCYFTAKDIPDKLVDEVLRKVDVQRAKILQLVPYMHRECIITNDEHQQLTNSQTTDLMRGNLLSRILMGKRVHWLLKFCHCLLQSYESERGLDIHYTLLQQIKGDCKLIVLNVNFSQHHSKDFHYITVDK